MPRYIIEIPDYIEQEDGDWMDVLVEMLDEANIPASVDYSED